MPIVYELDPHLDTDEFIDILSAHRSPIGGPLINLP